MIKVIIHGCNGHMGQVTKNIIRNDDDAQVVAGIDAITSSQNDFPEFTSIDECNIDADVIIDFSTAKAIDSLLSYGKEKNIPMVICTTGLSDEQLENLKSTSNDVAILRSANMSLGINTIQKLIAEAARILECEGFDIEIVEAHHRRKLDAPSGTAIALGESINSALTKKREFVFDRSDRRKARPDGEIGFSSIRGGTIVGEHDVIFAGNDEVVTISHQAFSRDIFAKGAVSAAKFLSCAAPGLYDMSDVIG